MKFRDIPEDKKPELESIADFAEHVVKKFELEKYLSEPHEELVEMVEFFLPIGAEDFLDIADHVSDLEEALHKYHGLRGVYIPSEQGDVQLLYRLILEEFYIFYKIKYSKKDISIPSKQSFELTEDERGRLGTPRYYGISNQPSQGTAFVRHVIQKFKFTKWLDSYSYEDIFDAILEPVENAEYYNNIPVRVHRIEDALYTLANKKALFTPYPEGEMTRTFYLLLEEYYNYFDIPYTDEDINIDNTWKIDGHIVHKEHIPEFTEEKPQNISKTHTKVWGGEIKVYEHSDPVWQKVYDELDAFNDHVIQVLGLEQKFFVGHEDIASWLSTFIISGLQTLGNPLEKIGCELGTFDVAIRDEFYRECDKGNVPEDAEFKSMESEILAEFIKYFKLG